MNNEVLSREYASYRMNGAHQVARNSRLSAKRMSFSERVEKSVVAPVAQLISLRQIRIANLYRSPQTRQSGVLKGLVVYYETSIDEILCRVRGTFARLTGALNISTNSGVKAC